MKDSGRTLTSTNVVERTLGGLSALSQKCRQFQRRKVVGGHVELFFSTFSLFTELLFFVTEIVTTNFLAQAHVDTILRLASRT